MSDAIAQLVAAATEKYTAANALAQKVAKSHGSVAKDVKEARDTSEDPELVKDREWLEKAQAAINARIEKMNAYILEKGIVKGETMTDDEVAKAKEEHKTLKAAGNEAWNAAEAVAKILGSEMPAKPEVLTFSGKPSAGKSGGSGTGGRRLRFSRVEVNGVEVKNLSAVSQKIKSDTGKSVSAADLQKALFESAGTDDLVKIGDHTFGWSETSEDGTVHKYDVTVYAAKREDETPAAKSE